MRNQLHQSRFPASGGTDDSDGLVGRKMDVNLMEDRHVSIVTESKVFKRDFAIKLLRYNQGW